MAKKTLLTLLVPLVLSGMAGCTTAPHHGYHFHDGYLYSGHPFYHNDYLYYPNLAVYFHVHSGHYYYRHDSRWIRSRHLPKKIYLDHRHRRRLVIREKEPYRHHHKHRKRYETSTKYRAEKKYDRAERKRHRELHENYKKRPRR